MNAVRKRLSPFDFHKLKIARSTLRMSDVGARIMGGMTKKEAKAVIKELTGKDVGACPACGKIGILHENCLECGQMHE